jgi:hypothetical protein
MDETAGPARLMWTLFEPVHAVSYFTPEARSAFEEAGLRGFWRGYFAGRAAPLGVTSAAVVCASFFNFAPAMVARAIPGVWELITPAEALRLRLAGAAAALRRLLGGLDAEVAAAADLLGRAAGELDCAGRVLGAANAALPVPDDPVQRLWQAATVLREHRGDGHAGALVAAGVDGCGALVLRCGLELRREDLQPIRGWTDEQWDQARSGLARRGWVGPGGELTDAGRVGHAGVEEATDTAAAGPWARLGPAAVAQLTAVLTPVARACATALPYPSPIGVPVPGSPDGGRAPGAR